MNKRYKTSLFIFRRDLRIEDNTALNAAFEQSMKVIACFILNPEQISANNPYRGDHSIKFMAESLIELHDRIAHHAGKLYIFHDIPTNAVDSLIKREHIEAVFVNKDYTPYSKKRDTVLADICANHGVEFLSFSDVLLVDPEDGINKSGKPYLIFTPFYKKNSLVQPLKPITHSFTTFANHKIAHDKGIAILMQFLTGNELYVTGGRSSALTLLKKLSDFHDYKKTHDLPSIDTTLLSAHNKFGTTSIREVYYAFKSALGLHHPLIRQLYWRDFFYHIAAFYPHVFGSAFYEKYNQLPWSSNEHYFKRWCEGTTGFPIVDAGMRQLNETGFMHNRARLIVGSFLVKDLHIDWRLGERYFAQMLTDYDPAVNNGNWQWVASTGCDRQPYFRIFNPWLQQKRFDSNCDYIKTWIPELRNMSSSTIHLWYKQNKGSNGYPLPIVDHDTEAARTKTLYRIIAQTTFEGTI